MKKRIIAFAMVFAFIFSIIPSSINVFAFDSSLTEINQSVYNLEEYADWQEEANVLYKGHIDVSNVNIAKNNLGENVEYSLAIENLRTKMGAEGKGAMNTSVFFNTEDNPTDAQENIFKTDVDFVGRVLEQPINVVFVMDQSGSMNMVSNKSNTIKSASPCMNPNHYYRIQVNIDGTLHYYFFNPTDLNMTGTWVSHGDYSALENHIATTYSKDASKVQVVDFTSVYSPQDNHYSLILNAGESKGDVNLLYLQSDTSFSNNFKYVPSLISGYEEFNSNEEYYSPDYKNSDSDGNEFINTEEYIEYLDATDSCYDRMLISKILFKDLSDIVLEGPGNKIGYVQFANIIHNQSPLTELSFDNNFTLTTGYPRTNYSLALTTAQSILDADTPSSDPTKLDPKNFIIFISDGEPYPSSAGVDTVFMNNFITNTDAIIYFAGIDLDEEIFNTWSSIIATTGDSSDIHLAENGYDLASLVGIRDALEKIINSASKIEINLEDFFNLKIDDSHPIQITWKADSDSSPTTITATSLNDETLVSAGIVYDEASDKLIWNITQREVVEARISFYQEIDDSKILWETINSGSVQTEQVLGESTVDFIDINGFIKTLTNDNPTSVTLQGNSKLRIKNETSTATNINVGDEIKYSITVSNTGSVDAHNLIVHQSIPTYTSYKSHTDSVNTATGVYDDNKNQILFTIPQLKANESITFEYSVVANSYNVSINSSSKLGASNEITTFNADGTPILTATTLTHKTNAQPTSPPQATSAPTTPAPSPAPTATLPVIGPISTDAPEPTPTTAPSTSPTIQPTQTPDAGIKLPVVEGEDDEFVDVSKVEIDDEELGDDDYTIDEAGNITINPEYIASLPSGEHTLVITTSDGDVYEVTINTNTDVPLSDFTAVYSGAWSLFDLIMTLLSIILALIYIIKRRKDDDEKEDEYNENYQNEDDEDEKQRKSKLKLLILLVAALCNLILFVFTQNLKLPMVIFDKWSIVFAVIVLIQLVILIFIKRKNDDESQGEDEKIIYKP